MARKYTWTPKSGAGRYNNKKHRGYVTKTGARVWEVQLKSGKWKTVEYGGRKRTVFSDFSVRYNFVSGEVKFGGEQLIDVDSEVNIGSRRQRKNKAFRIDMIQKVKERIVKDFKILMRKRKKKQPNRSYSSYIIVKIVGLPEGWAKEIKHERDLVDA